MHAKMQYLNDRRDDRERLRQAWASRDRSPRGKETALKVWSRQANRRERRDRRADVAERLMEHEAEVLQLDHEGCLPVYRWEPGYRGDMEDVLGLDPSVHCRYCGRFLPALEADPYHTLGLEALEPVAHVGHDHKPCPGSPIRQWR